MLLIFEGPPALSDFRRAALLQRCRAVLPRISGLSATHLYLVHLKRAPDPGEHACLEQILQARSAAPAEGSAAVLVCPRPGTISPWSSKATNILHHCGMDAVVRIERGTAYRFETAGSLSTHDLEPLMPLIHDRMTEAVVEDPEVLFRSVARRPLERIALLERGRGALEAADAAMGLALSSEEMDYFHQVFLRLGRDPTDVELMMFAVVNSEHCRHKIFNAAWRIDGRRQERSLFEMIRNTHARNPGGCVKAYADNAGVIEGFKVPRFQPLEAEDHRYRFSDKLSHIVLKVETHNHPTAISPYPGASTGVGGEIRDEGSTGTGARSQAGLCAYFTSHLHIPGCIQPWEEERSEFPSRLATPLEIMTEAPIGAAAFGNEFGRPNICGLFRTFEGVVDGRHRGYHKPIMVAGGVGLIDAGHVEKKELRKGDYVIQLGGPAMLIGLGGGAASSMDSGSNAEDLDFASVQRDNPEMQRRCQDLIDRCISLGRDNPIRSIHDVGAGGLSNACPELVEKSGACFDLRAVHNDDPGMSPMQIWSNEAQERYVLVIGRSDLRRFAALAERERCLFAVIGEISGDGKLTLRDPLGPELPIDGLDLKIILGKPPRMERDVSRRGEKLAPLDLSGVSIPAAAARVLRFPAVAAKTFLVTIADRSVTGLVARDQMVGPYQVPVADAAVTAASFKGYRGSAMAMGERAPLALIDSPAAGRMAVAEAIANIAAASIGPIGRVKLAANWMCACGEEGEDARLYDTVRALGMEFCPALGVAIPVGKDSLSMRTLWRGRGGESRKVTAPLSLVISAFAPVLDIRRTLTPELKKNPGARLALIDLGRGRNRLGASALAQVYGKLGDAAPDIDPGDLGRFYHAVQEMIEGNLLLAYHDRSDGGLFVTVAEMAFASRSGVALDITSLGGDPLAVLFSEEAGAVIQYDEKREEEVRGVLGEYSLLEIFHPLGQPDDSDQLQIHQGKNCIYRDSVAALQQAWSELTFRMQARRDNPDCAREEYEAIADGADPGLQFRATGAVLPARNGGPRPRVAILREQGINGQVEMAAAFDAAGFAAVDVTMTDLQAGRARLDDFQGLVACGGFSYGDVLGAGAGWARSILFNQDMRSSFAAFFARPDTFTLGVCNGCQMLSHLRELIPGAGLWPSFLRNRSEQFEARLATVEILESRSILFRGMAGSRLGIACAHGEGRAAFADSKTMSRAMAEGQVCMRFVDNHGAPTERYPCNPNGSPGGITSLTSSDGRATIMMPHPERVFRNVQLSWKPGDWSGEDSPWLRLFQNAHAFCRD